jgi:hypothetical protein
MITYYLNQFSESEIYRGSQRNENKKKIHSVITEWIIYISLNLLNLYSPVET